VATQAFTLDVTAENKLEGRHRACHRRLKQLGPCARRFSLSECQSWRKCAAVHWQLTPCPIVVARRTGADRLTSESRTCRPVEFRDKNVYMSRIRGPVVNGSVQRDGAQTPHPYSDVMPRRGRKPVHLKEGGRHPDRGKNNRIGKGVTGPRVGSEGSHREGPMGR